MDSWKIDAGVELICCAVDIDVADGIILFVYKECHMT